MISASAPPALANLAAVVATVGDADAVDAPCLVVSPAQAAASA